MWESLRFYTPIGVGANLSMFVWNKNTWKELGTELQDIVTRISKEVEPQWGRQTDGERDTICKQWEVEYGLQGKPEVLKFCEELRTFQNAWKCVISLATSLIGRYLS